MRSTYRTHVIPFIPEPAMPLVRTVYYTVRGSGANLRARLPSMTNGDAPPVFIIGCGRSGTTLLGEIFSTHPRVRYRYEPYHLWAAVQPNTDFLELYTRGVHHCLLSGESVTGAAQMRFRRLMSPRSGSTLVEKSPINALRIGFLEAIAPRARFVHIVRDGVQVAHSIEQMASVTRPMAFRPPLNDWWGVQDAKWKAMVRDATGAGYYSQEISQLANDHQRGAFEWLLSMRELESWRPRLGGRLVELKLDDLIASPRETLRTVLEGLGSELSAPTDAWLEKAIKKVCPSSRDYDTELYLPPRMRADFNRFQEVYGFKGRSVASSLGMAIS